MMSAAPALSRPYEGTYQVDTPCTKCGGFYRRAGACSSCKEPTGDRPYDAANDRGFSYEGRAPRGQIWDSKKHRYVGSA